MGLLDEAFEEAAGEKPVAGKPAAKLIGGKRENLPSGTTNNADRLKILQQELETENQNLTHQNPEVRQRAPANIASLQREIAALSGQKAPVAAQPAAVAPPAAPAAPVAQDAGPAAVQPGSVAVQPDAAKPAGGMLDQMMDEAADVAPETAVQPSADGAQLAQGEEKSLPEVEVVSEPMSDFAKSLAALIDNTAGGIAPFVAKQGSYLIGRTVSSLGELTGIGKTETPEETQKYSDRLASVFAQPIGKMFGIDSNDPAYNGEAVGRFFQYLGDNVKESSQNIHTDLQNKGIDIPTSDIEWMMNSVLPKVMEKVAPVAGKAAGKTAEIIEPAVAAVETKVSNAAQALKEQFAAKKAGGGEKIEPSLNATGTQRGSVGAAATSDAATIQQALSVATPELQAIIKDIPVDKVNLPTLTRHIEADTLPVPIRLTEGQATGDIVKMSNEQNQRGKNPELAHRFNEQNAQLTENINAIREIAAPDVYGTKTIENSQSVIDAYKKMDADKSEAIGKAYKDLLDANGGSFPVDGKKIATDANGLLAKNLKSEFVPAPIRRQLRRFESGEQMTFEQFEALRTNIAAESRKAEKGGDGNAAMALSLVRQAMENLPLAEGTGKQLKGLADNARSLAKQRFDSLAADPAYRAAINDKIPADQFIDKFVINGHHKNIATMIQNLGENSEAHQHMAAGTVNWLKDKAGIVDEQGNFSQAGFNKALKKLDDVNNLNAIFNPEASTQLKNLGNVSRYTQAQPRGSFVNNSNTLVGALANHAAGLAESGANIMMGGKYGIPVGSIVRSKVQEIKAGKETAKSLETGAGIRNK